MKQEHVVFVYGTLLRGEPNHSLLARSRMLGATATEAAFEFVDVGGYPALVEGGRTAVSGELYEVDDITLEHLDALEGHPHYYLRATVTLRDGRQAQTYVLPPEDASGCPRIASGDWRKHRTSTAQTAAE